MNRQWSSDVTETSDALDLEEGIFTWDDPNRIAKSQMESAKKSKRRKGSPKQSAMSMLNFYINRAGKNLTRDRINILNQAKKNLTSL